MDGADSSNTTSTVPEVQQILRKARLESGRMMTEALLASHQLKSTKDELADTWLRLNRSFSVGNTPKKTMNRHEIEAFERAKVVRQDLSRLIGVLNVRIVALKAQLSIDQDAQDGLQEMIKKIKTQLKLRSMYQSWLPSSSLTSVNAPPAAAWQRSRNVNGTTGASYLQTNSENPTRSISTEDDGAFQKLNEHFRQ
jgi:hypothetical protein